MKNFLLNIYLILFCGYSIMLYPYSKEWDIKFRKLLEDNDFEIDGLGFAKLGELELWIANQPYACFLYETKFIGIRLSVRPSRVSVYYGLKKLNNKINKLKQIQLNKINS